jgi:DNA-directed RNA polymerase subunit alpha
MNPEVHLFTLEGTGTVSIELGIGIGRGYESADKKASVPAGAIPLDSAFSPITKVSYNVEMSRLGKITDYEKLVVEIWTNGAVSPEEALERSATFLREHFTPLRAAPPDDDGDAEADGAYLREALGKTLEELDLAARAVNALKAADIMLVADLAQKTEADLGEVKNLGEKTIDEIKAALAALGLSLGMRIDPNVLGALGRGVSTK